MQDRSILRRILALPLRHKLTAAAIAIAVASGFFMWGRRAPERYASPALLSYDASTMRHTEVDETQPSAIQLAQSVLNDEQVTILASHLDIPHPQDGSSLIAFRSHLKLDEVGPTILRLQYVDPNVKQAVAVTNAAVEILTAWNPAAVAVPLQAAVTYPPATTAQSKPTKKRVMHAVTHTRHASMQSDDSLTRMESRLMVIDRRLDSERQKLDAAKVNHSVAEKQNNSRQVLETQLAAAQKKLEDLRARYTDEYPDVETAQEHIHDLQQQLAGLSAAHGEVASSASSQLEAVTREASQLRLEREHLTKEIAFERRRLKTDRNLDEVQPQAREVGMDGAGITASSSTESLANASSPKQVQNQVNQILMNPFTLLQQSSYTVARSSEIGNGMWLRVLMALICALAYLGLAVRWYKPVLNEAMLTQAIPKEVAYMGTVPRMNL